MTEYTIHIRLDQLINAYSWSKTNDKVRLSDGERICISQERAALMSVLDGRSRKPRYEVPESIEIKIQLIIQIIKNTDWERPIYVPEPY